MFETPDAGGILHGVREFLKHPDREGVAKRAMRQDFSWDGPAQAYLGLYRELVG